MTTKMTTQTARTVLVLLAAGTLAACATSPRTDARFGNAVRHMVASQTVVTGPVDRNPVEGTDGQRVENVLSAYRSDVSTPEDVQAPLVIDLGSGR